MLRSKRRHRYSKMKFVSVRYMSTSLQIYQNLFCVVLTVRKTRRNVNVPIWERTIYRLNPFSDACLASIYFLTTPNKTNDNRPVLMAIKTGNQEFRLGKIKVRSVFLTKHE